MENANVIEEGEEIEITDFENYSKEELIEMIQEIREEYHVLEDKMDKLYKRYEAKIKEIAFTRKLLTEREDLLLQLQWEPNQDSTYLQQIGATDPNHANEIKTKLLLDQSRIMEKGIFERDEKIKQLEKIIEKFTLSQIDSGQIPQPIAMPVYSTIPPATSTTVTPVTYDITNHKLNPNFKSLTEYPLSRSLDDLSMKKSTVEVVTHHSPNSQKSFWRSTSSYIGSWLGYTDPEEATEPDQVVVDQAEQTTRGDSDSDTSSSDDDDDDDAKLN